MFNGDTNGDSSSTTIDQMAELESTDFGDPLPLSTKMCRDSPTVESKSKDYSGVLATEIAKLSVTSDANVEFFRENKEKTVGMGDINHNSGGDDETSCLSDKEKDISESDNSSALATADVVETFLDMERSNETSTETLVGEESICP